MTDPDFLALPPMTILETPRLRLRTVRVSDAKALLPVITDETTMKFTSGVVLNDLDVAERWLSARVLGKDVLNFVVTVKNSSNVDGDGVDDGGLDLDGEEGKGKGQEVIVGIMGSYHWPEVGYLMHPAHAGKGYATEALHAFLQCYFSRVPSPSSHPGALGFDYLQAETDAENIGSQKVLLKCGFQLVETLQNAFDSPALGLRDTLVYRVARPGMTLEGLGLVEKPVRLLELRARAARGTATAAATAPEENNNWDEKAEEEGFVPPVQ